jgi:uncharacterized membrane protein
MTESATKPKQGVLGSLLTGPAFAKLAEEASKYAVAKAEHLTHRGNPGTQADKVTPGTEDGDKSSSARSPKISALVEGAKSAVEGKSAPTTMVKSAATALREKVKGAFGGIDANTGELKMTNIEESIDIGLPVDVVYNQWTQIAEFPKFMKGVENIDQESETESTWRVKVAFSHRSWKARITEQVPDRRIVWTSEGEKGYTQGAVTFHALADDLTRVLLSMEYYPSGFFEKTGNLWRAGGRRARLDLKHFRRFVSLSGEATGAWRGEIRDGEIVGQQDGEPDQGDRRDGSAASRGQAKDRDETDRGGDEDAEFRDQDDESDGQDNEEDYDDEEADEDDESRTGQRQTARS